MTLHKGAARRYFCAHFFDDKGRINPSVGGCDNLVINDGEHIPHCPVHGLPMRKTRFKRVEEKQWERNAKAQFQVQGTAIWTDIARRRARCHLCNGQIDPGEERIAFDASNRWGVSKTRNGGIIKSVRNYVHKSCFVDLIMDGKPGEGCPGCTAKMINDEFKQVRDQLKKRHA